MDGILREAVVDSFMEVTSCGSQLIAVRLLDSCGWQLEAAINRYFTTGAADPAPDPPVAARSETMHDDTVRDPIPARSSTLYGNENLYAAGSTACPRRPYGAPTGRGHLPGLFSVRRRWNIRPGGDLMVTPAQRKMKTWRRHLHGLLIVRRRWNIHLCLK
ncbi:hypothetical protein ZWY2020_010619 [Hordeum vulgare]|nr:hypothetical protein ZWY2020_010619 [Hordeum vulgare]